MSQAQPIRARWPWLVFAAAVILAPLIGTAVYRMTRQKPPKPPLAAADMEKAVALNNRGMGLMEKYEYAPAAEVFQQAREAAPDWTIAEINYAIARMNVADPPDLDAAIDIFEAVLRREPKNLHAHYCLGIIIKYRNRLPDAIRHFEAVTNVDDGDAGAWFHLGDCLLQIGEDRDRAVQCLEKAFARNPYLRGPLWQLQGRLQAEDPQRADKLLKEFQNLEAAEVLADLATRYTCMGSKYAEVIGKVEHAKVQAAPPPVFRPAEKFVVRLSPGAKWAKDSDFGTGPLGNLRRAARQRFGGTIIRLDFNRDDRIDLFLLGAVVENGKVRNLLLQNMGNGEFNDVTAASGLSDSSASLGCCAGDFDNDGQTDLFVSGAGVQRLYRNKGNGSFEDVSQTAGLDKLTSVCLGCTWIDLEQDGDLDLVMCEYAANIEQAASLFADGKNAPGGIRAFLNAGIALPAKTETDDVRLTVRFERFHDFEKSINLTSPMVGLAVSDADNDRDLDLLLFAENQRPKLVINDRLLRFRTGNIDATAEEHAWNGALVLDVDHDERSELLLLAKDKTMLLRNQSVSGQPAEKGYVMGATNAPALRQAQIADVDLDGWTDVVGLSHDGKPVFLINDWEGKLENRTDMFGLDREWKKDLIGLAIVDMDGDSNPDLLTWSEADGLELHASRGNGNQCLKIALNGRRLTQKRPVLRTNQDGFGALIAAQAGRLWTGLEATTLSAGLGQSCVPIELGLGSAKSAEAVRLRWPDLVVQAEIDVACAGVRRIRQVGRKPDSCPVIFAWNGEKFVYITDCLGAGSVGEMLAQGGTRPPRPEESVKIDGKHLKLENGRYVLKIGEPMDEIMYLDRAQLVAVDHPGDVHVFPDERFAVSDPPPSQELLCFRDRFFAQSARTSNNNDVTATVREWDRKTVDDFHNTVWLGVADEHWVELDFGKQLADLGPKDRVALCLAGWTEYAYPHTIFGLVQAGTPLIAPLLETQDANGQWRPVAELGFPAGEPRMMTVELTGKLAGHQGKLRVRTNMQVFWDQIFIAPLVSKTVLKPRVTELHIADANLAYHGFCQEYLPDGKLPLTYDHDRLDNIAVSKWTGWLTRYGDVAELLHNTDDRFLIAGPGDEITLQFDASGLTPVPAGWTRSFVLRTWGYCKDNAPFTATAGYVQPIPFRAMNQYPPGADEPYPHAEDMGRWHTRRTGK